ncbi:mitochondrial cardiolipin hydrolase-like [Ostrinia nubilalis]|uniref:mitochondrial cardiolipin hydrolase-like n=1 Tax=Ostrinia nubilalis TaxID=29057 RepID=UPI00308243E3
MRIHPRILSTAAAIAVTCVVSAAAYFFKSRRSSELNEVMIFCKLQFNAYNYFDKLISYVEAAKRSVNVCMPGIHNPAIQGRLVSLIKKKNIKARILIDPSGYNESTEFFMKELAEAGAEIKCIVNEPIRRMHHKFCLIDDNVLMAGTLNWGDDRSSDHWNYVYVTSKLELVEPVKNGFYQMWNDFSMDAAHVASVEASEDNLEDSGTTAEVEYKSPNVSISENKQKNPTPELVLV